MVIENRRKGVRATAGKISRFACQSRTPCRALHWATWWWCCCRRRRRLPRCCCSIPIPHSRSHPPNALLNVVHMLHAQELGAWQHQSVCWPLPCQCCRRCTACCCHPLPPAHVHLFVHTCHLLLLGSIESSPLHTPMLLLCCMPRRCLAAAAPRACRRTATAPTAAVLPCRPRPRAPIGPRPWPSSREG